MSTPPLRLWPGVAAAVALLVMRYVVPVVWPAMGVAGLIAAFVSALAILVWWLGFSRAPWLDRLGAVVVMIAALVVTRPLLDPSIATGGMGALQYLLAIPVMCVALVAWASVAQGRSHLTRRASLVVVMLAACGALTLLRTGGIGGGGIADLHWRWTPTAEERLLANADDVPPATIAPAVADAPAEPTAPEPTGPGPVAAAPVDPDPDVPPTPIDTTTAPAGEVDRAGSHPPVRAPEWPGFRGPARDGVIHGVRIATDWTASPPVELWRRAIGPGWSSFAVDGDYVYTQEQRGDDEIVASYSLATGEPLWMHRDATRFWESNAGPGPRGTPTLGGNRVYAFGATGLVNALDARTGAVVWQRDARADTGARIPDWGFASSPLVVGEVVIVAVAGQLIAYDRVSGEPRWTGAPGGTSYSSPHLATIDGVPQVLFLGGSGVTSIDPASGRVLWDHAWEGGAIVQPSVIGDRDVLINAIAWTGGVGTRRLAVERATDGWRASERWTSNGLKPYYNDFVVHEGYAYGFDGSILASLDLADGRRAWKGGRYGAGQLVLLADQSLLLVVSEDGDLALVRASPDAFTEVARVPAIEGKTWNHPALAGDVLLVRNGEEMAAFRLALAAD